MKPAKGFPTVAISLLAVCLAWAGDPWKEKSPAEWTQKDVQKILLKSPWVKNILVGRIRPSGSGAFDKPVNTAGLTKGQAENEAVLREAQGTMIPRPVTEGLAEAPPPNARRGPVQPSRARSRLTVRWFSSRTVREGLIRNWQLQLAGLPQPEQAGEILQRENPQAANDPKNVERLTRTVRQKRSILQQNIEQMQARLARPSPYYEIVVNPIVVSESSRRTLREVSYLQPKKSKAKIPAARIEVSGQSVIFYFPREMDGRPIIGTEEKKIRFFTKFGSRAVKTDFNLKKMVRDGAPDL